MLWACAHGPCRLDQQRIDLLDRRNGIEQQRPGAAIDNHRDLRQFANPEQQDEHRQQRKRCGVAANLDELIQEIAEPGIPADHQTKRNDQHDRNQKSAQGAQQAGGDVFVELAGLRKLPAGRDHFRKRRQEHLIDQAQPRSGLPYRQQRHQQQRPVPEDTQPAELSAGGDKSFQFEQDALMNPRVGDDSGALVGFPLAGLKLRFDEGNDLAPASQQAGGGGQDFPQRNE